MKTILGRVGLGAGRGRGQRRGAWLRGVGLVLLGLGILTGEARAEQRGNVLQGQPAIRKRVEFRKLRFEITPGIMISVNQDFRQFVGGSLALQFHITDWLGVAVQGAGGFNYDTSLTRRLVETLPAVENGLQPSRQQFRDHLADIRYLFSAYLTITPFSGKLSFFSSGFIRYDFYGLVGLGGLVLSNNWDPNAPGNDPQCTGGNPNRCDPSNDGLRLGLMWGLGVHLFFNQWFGIHAELRDYIASTNPSGFDVNGDPQRRITREDQTLQNNLFVSAGLNFLFPTRAKISR